MSTDALLPLSYMQERLWFIEQLGALGPTYNMVQLNRLLGPLDRDALERAVRELACRHEQLRARIVPRDGVAYESLGEPASIAVSFDTLNGSHANDSSDAVQRWAQQLADRPFDLTAGPLFRIAVLEVKADEHLLMMSLHHIVCDAWSIGILRADLFSLYESFAAGRTSPLSTLPARYADFVAWQRSWVRDQTLQRHLEFWADRLRGVEPLSLPADRLRPPVPSFRGDEVRFEIEPEVVARLDALRRPHGATRFMVLFAVFSAWLSRLSGNKRFVVGSPVAGRTQASALKTVGFFANTIALPADLTSDPSFTELLQQVKELMLDAFRHQDMPFEQLVAHLQPHRDRSAQPLFQVMLAWINTGQLIECVSGLQVHEYSDLLKRTTAKFDLLCFVAEGAATAANPGSLSVLLEYATDLFDRATVERFAGYFQALLRAVALSPDESVFALPLLSREEQQWQLVKWNGRGNGRVPSECVHDIVSEQARTTPGNIAVTDGAELLSYAELEARANRLARHLCAAGAAPERPVALCLEPTAQMIVAVLAVLKSGAPCLPLDPSYPRDRLELMLRDGGVSLTLCSSRYRALLPDHPSGILDLQDAVDAARQESSDALSGRVDPAGIAYVLYTSGSTGRPKGVAMPHVALANLIAHQRDMEEQRRPRRVLQLAPLTFDVSFQEIFATLCQGGTLVMAGTEARRDTRLLLALLSKYRIQELYAPQVIIQALAEHIDRQPPGAPLALERINQAGEPLKWTPAIARMLGRLPGAELQNHYGPTETHVASMFTVEDMPDTTVRADSASIPIGFPISSVQVYVLDERLAPVPIGVTGHLYIAGAGVARGYIGQSGITAERFIADPFGRPGARMYRTGDLARRRPNGALEFLGRADHQVKIRGYRVEPGEVEVALLAHPAIEEAVVVARPDESGHSRLIAYLVCSASVAVEALRGELRKKLPDFMVPAAFVVLETLQRLPSGKIDRAALPAPDGRRALQRECVAPRTPAQASLAAIWRELLGLDQVGVEDDFFELGGHSLLALKVVARIASELAQTVPVSALFETPTIASLCEAWLEGRPHHRPQARAGDFHEGVL